MAGSYALLFSVGNHFAHLRHGNHRHVADEEEQQREEQPNASAESEPVPKRRFKHTPTGRHEVPVQTLDDDDEAQSSARVA